MWKHYTSCVKRFEANKSQTVINPDESGSLVSWKFNQDRVREALVKMLILDELPLRCVEREGFILFMKEAQPLFKIPSRHAIREDIVKMYLTQKTYLRNFFGLKGLGRIYSHKGDDLASAITTIVDDWGLNRLFRCTLDNAVTNDHAIKGIMTRFVERNMLLAGGQYFHLRCVGHILNLVVDEGLAEIGVSVRRVREVVKWIKASPARSDKFKETAKLYKVETSKFLCLDVPTRWNSTYLMLESALSYAPVMAIFERVNPAFVRDLKQKTYNKIPIGVPEELDWHEVRRMCGYLKKFHKLTEEVSATTYPTSHTFFKEMCGIFTVIRRLEGHENEDIKRMAISMKSKLGKYWLEDKELNPRMNKIMYIAAMLDPRQKMKHVQLCLKTVYGDRRAAELVEMLKKSMYD
ncbi:zinc finger BED domain-containing protein RICESLEEPER 2-like [Salvia hispanica]|uniref:zinc finger BED domain-containing protein RICESLEEPER 2-like n=1 Tax=Salvia hispanica TaxID=49212 RepID=UPI00200913FB|nr:zinc finger BED domain-containing protein RICESLEEPER 2-like [Salvia hispanica]